MTVAEQQQVDQAVRTVNAILVRKNLEIAVELHRYVLDEFFGDSCADPHAPRGAVLVAGAAALLATCLQSTAATGARCVAGAVLRDDRGAWAH